jgi:hypothetical protein
MVKAIFAVVLALFATANACNTACSTSAEKNGRCYYNCTDACSSLSATTLRNSFLNGLEQEQFDCRDEGATGLSCVKSSAFGGCGTHYWTCGSGC